MPRGVLVDSRVAVKQEYYAGVIWDGTRKLPVMIFSDMGGIDIEEVAETHPDHVGRGHFSNLSRLSDYEAKEVIASTGVTGSRAHAAHADPRAARAAVRRVRHDAGRDQPARRARGRHVRRARRAHGHGERGPRRARRRCCKELGVGDEETRQAREATAFELAGEEVDAKDHRGVAGNVTEFDGNLGLVIGAGGGSLTLFDAVRTHGGKPGQLLRDRRQPVGREGLRAGQARAAEARRRQDRRDDVDRLQHARGHRRARRDQGVPRARATTRPRRSRSSASPAPGRTRASRSSRSTASSTATARVSMHEAARRAVEKIERRRA